MFKHIINIHILFYYTDVCRIWKKISLFLLTQSCTRAVHAPGALGLHCSRCAPEVGSSALPWVLGWMHKTMQWFAAPWHIVRDVSRACCFHPSPSLVLFQRLLVAPAARCCYCTSATGESLCFLVRNGREGPINDIWVLGETSARL